MPDLEGNFLVWFWFVEYFSVDNVMDIRDGNVTAYPKEFLISLEFSRVPISGG